MTAKRETGEPRDLDPLMEKLRDYMLEKSGSVEEFPFGPQVMVFRVVSKMFGLMAWEENPVVISLKCDPERSQKLREEHAGINGAYHLNKKHWHGLEMGGSVDFDLAKELMDHSYDLVVAALTAKEQEHVRRL